MQSLTWIKDKQFYVACALGVFFWGLYAFFVQPIDPVNLFLQTDVLFYSVLIFPILEELVFRGFVQTELMRRNTWTSTVFGISYANILTSVLFCTAHVFQNSLEASLAVFIPSLIFGYFRDRYQHVYASIALHIFYNAGFFTMFSR